MFALLNKPGYEEESKGYTGQTVNSRLYNQYI